MWGRRRRPAANFAIRGSTSSVALLGRWHKPLSLFGPNDLCHPYYGRPNRVRRFAQVVIFFFSVAGFFQVYRLAIEGGRSDAISPEESIRRDVAAYKLLVKLFDHENDILGKIAARNDGPAVAQYIMLNEALNEDLERVTGLRGRIALRRRSCRDRCDTLGVDAPRAHTSNSACSFFSPAQRFKFR
jgi:hypothetical protein